MGRGRSKKFSLKIKVIKVVRFREREGEEKMTWMKLTGGPHSANCKCKSIIHSMQSGALFASDWIHPASVAASPAI